MVEVFKDELENVLHNFQKGKSPSPDGLPIEFYLECYDFIRKDLLKVILNTLGHQVRS